MGVCRMHGDAAGALQPLGISEGDTGHPCPVPARVDPDQKSPFPVVVIILPIESLHHLHRLRVIPERIDDLKALRQFSCIAEPAVKLNYLICKCKHDQ